MVREGEKHGGGGVSLPEDIVFDVLTRLPAKALCRFRCVCKGWRALISDPAFVAAQGSRAGPHLVAAVLLGPHHLPEVRVMDMDGNVVREFEITRSTPLPPQLLTRQDLICANGTGLTWNGGRIIDPVAGRAFVAIDDTADPPPWTYDTYYDSFGRATPSGVFKVLRLLHPYLGDDHGDANMLLCEVASIMDGGGGGAAEPLTWRRKSVPPFVTSCRRCESVVVNGVVYIITHELEIDGDVDEDDHAAQSLYRIVPFDLESEEWKAEAINGPALGQKAEGEIWLISLVELHGTLAFVQEVLVDTYPYIMNIWLLIDPDKSVWVKKYMIPMPKNHMRSAKPLGALVDGRILLLLYDTYSNQIVLFYDPSTKVFTDFVEMPEGFGFTFFLYTGSLLS